MSQIERSFSKNPPPQKPSTRRLVSPTPGRNAGLRGDTHRLKQTGTPPDKPQGFSYKLKLVMLSCMPVMILVLIGIFIFRKPAETIKYTRCPVCNFKVIVTEGELEKRIIFKCEKGHEFIIDNKKVLNEADKLLRRGETLYLQAMDMDPSDPQRKELFDEAYDEYLEKAGNLYAMLRDNNESVEDKIMRISNIQKDIRWRRTR